MFSIPWFKIIVLLIILSKNLNDLKCICPFIMFCSNFMVCLYILYCYCLFSLHPFNFWKICMLCLHIWFLCFIYKRPYIVSLFIMISILLVIFKWLGLLQCKNCIKQIVLKYVIIMISILLVIFKWLGLLQSKNSIKQIVLKYVTEQALMSYILTADNSCGLVETRCKIQDLLHSRHYFIELSFLN